MKTRLTAVVALLLILAIFTSAAQPASGNPPATSSTPSSKTPGVELAQTLSMITGVAISPLLGVGAVGAWQYYKAETPEQKARLHWYANPMFWIPALILVALCLLKDTAGTALPTVLKKPLDIADTIEHKISGLVATGAFVPLAVSMFQEINPDGGASLNALGFAAVDASALSNVLIIALAMFLFFIVFLASNAINILILLSPFTTLDAGLKAFRVGVLGTVVATAWINPWLGAIWAALVILFAYCIAGWSFRLSHFGVVFIWDFLTHRRCRWAPAPNENKMFLGRKINQVPARTYGRLHRTAAGKLVFKFRPFLIFPERELDLPEGRYAAGRGLLYSEILRLETNESRTVLLLPPRYLGHETELAEIYALEETRPVGMRAAWAWMKSMLRNRPLAVSA